MYDVFEYVLYVNLMVKYLLSFVSGSMAGLQCHAIKNKKRNR